MRARVLRYAAVAGQLPVRILGQSGAGASRYEIRGEPDCAVAQTAAIALLDRGTVPVHQLFHGAGNATLQIRTDFDETVTLTDPAEMLRWIGDLHPAHPQPPAYGAARKVLRNVALSTGHVRHHLGALTAARNSRDVDLAWHGLRSALRMLDETWADQPVGHAGLSDADILLAPLLWRVRILDAAHRTHIAGDLERLTARGRRLHGHEAIARTLDRPAARRFLDRLEQSHAAVVRQDAAREWVRAFGPAGHEPRLQAAGALTCPASPATDPQIDQPLSEPTESWRKMTTSLPARSFNIDRIVHDLAEARRDWRVSHDRIEEPGPRELPSREKVAEIVENLRGILYPMRLGPPDLRQEQENRYIALTLDRVLGELLDQIRLELGWAARNALRGPEAADPSQAEAIVAAFASGLPEIRRLLDSDVTTAYGADPAARSVDEVLLCYPGVQALICHRIAHSLHGLGVPLIARLIAEMAHSQTGIDIHPGATIGAGLFIDHGTGVVIGATAIIGNRVQIFQAVTLGAKSFPQDTQGRAIKGIPRHPIVEDDVVIYSGATILGRVTIGRGAVIGGSVWVTEDVPSYAVLSQAKARSLSHVGERLQA